MAYEAVKIERFIGMDTTTNNLNLLPGQLQNNENYLYQENGGLSERGGGAKIMDPPSAGRLYGLSNFVDQNSVNWLICTQGTDAYYESGSSWNALSLTLTTSKTMRFEGAGFTTTKALYGTNATDGVVKIDLNVGPNVPQASILNTGAPDNAPDNMTYLKLHKNRMFGIDGQDTLYFTDVLDFDTWDSTNNNIQIAPGIDGNLQSMEVWGDALFLFKEYAVYVLVNADDPTPTSWKVLKTDANIGTQSPDTVKRTKRGLFYLSSDNFIRLLSPTVSYSSAEFTLGGSDSPIVSHSIQNDLNTDLSKADKGSAHAIVFEDLYVVSYRSRNNASDYPDKTFFADVGKSIAMESIPNLQPFWGKFTGFDYQFLTLFNLTGQNRLYGAKGITASIGEVQETLNESINNDNSTAIESKATLGWVPIGGESVFKRFNKIYFVGATENWDISLYFNAYKYGKGSVPKYDEGISKTFTSNTGSQAIMGSIIIGTTALGASGIASENFSFNKNGHFFQAHFENLNVDEKTSIYSMEIYYRPIKRR